MISFFLCLFLCLAVCLWFVFNIHATRRLRGNVIAVYFAAATQQTSLVLHIERSLLIRRHTYYTGIGVDFGGSPGTCPPIIEKRPCICHFLPPLPPPDIL